MKTASNTLSIEGELTIFRAAELRTQLITALGDAGSTLELNLTGVTEMDSAGVQLLMAAKKSAHVTQQELRLVGHSPAVLDVFERMDLAAHFGDPLLMPAAH